MPGSPYFLDEQARNLTITGLTPNTNYSIEVYASTSAGAGNSSIELNQTDEDSKSLLTHYVLNTRTFVQGYLITSHYHPLFYSSSNEAR